MPRTKSQVLSRSISTGYGIPDTVRRTSDGYAFFPGVGYPAFRIKLPLLSVFLTAMLLITGGTARAQDKEQETANDSTNTENRVVVRDTIVHKTNTIDPLSPSKAAFYSAILPGLGQIYNKRYWKVPLVYGAIGTGLYFYITNKDQYHRYRNAYKRRLAGFHDDEFYDIDGSGINEGNPDVSMDALRRAQEYYQRYKDLSLLITIGLYALNIIDANVDAHLKQHNISDELTLRPFIIPNDFNVGTTVGLSLNFNF